MLYVVYANLAKLELCSWWWWVDMLIIYFMLAHILSVSRIICVYWLSGLSPHEHAWRWGRPYRGMGMRRHTTVTHIKSLARVP